MAQRPDGRRVTDNRAIRVVLDATAAYSYARGHIHVGELINQVGEERGSRAALPAVALLEARHWAGHDPVACARLDVLANLPLVEVLPLDSAATSAIAPTVEVTAGDLSRAHAVWAALLHKAHYVTTEPKKAPLLVASQVVAIPTDDA
jgi:hypothetical protein